MKKKSLLFLLCVLFLVTVLTVPNYSYAEENLSNDIYSLEEAKVNSENYLNLVSKASYKKWENASISESKILYDTEDNVAGYLFQINKNDKDLGYIIASSNKTGSPIIESTRVGSNPYKGLGNEKAIYKGPLRYLKKDNGKYVEIQDKSYDNNHIRTDGTESKNAVKYQAATTPKSNISESIPGYKSGYIPGTLAFKYYLGCSPTAGAIVIDYWGRNGYPNLFSNGKDPNDIISWLANDMKTDSDGGTNTSYVYYGLKKYWNDHGYLPSISMDKKFTFEKYKNEIKNKRIILLGLSNDFMYGEHNIVGIGYQEFKDPMSDYVFRDLIINDGWKFTPDDVYISYNDHSQYISEAVYIEPPTTKDVKKGFVFNNGWYLFSEKGAMLLGWQNNNGKWYYLQDDLTLYSKNSWRYVNDKGYFDSGLMLKGWQELNSKWYYLDPNPGSNEGVMLKDWQFINGKWYYLDLNPGSNEGVMLKDWQFINEQWYYLDQFNGDMIEPGKQVIKGKWYIIDDSGAMSKGWKQYQNYWYYLDPNPGSNEGVMLKGWQFIDGKWYYLNVVGEMITESRSIDGKWYNFRSDGSLIE